MRTKGIAAAVFVLSTQLGFTDLSSAQDAKNGCQGQTVAACAQMLVELANKLVDTNKDLAKRLSSLETDVAAYKSLNDAVVKNLNQSAADQKTADQTSRPTVAYWDKGALTPISGPLKLTAQTTGADGPNGWSSLHINYGKTFKSNPVIVASSGQLNDSTIANIFDVRLDHFSIYLRHTPNNGPADPNIPLYFVIFPPQD